jgi:hypothetical protein
MTDEQAEVLGWFTELLRSVTADGGRKRARGLKPSWKVDTSHEAAMWSHINKWKHGECVDPDSGQHPLVHLAWRALAIAWQENKAAPDGAPTEAPVESHPPKTIKQRLDELQRTGNINRNPFDYPPMRVAELTTRVIG